MHCQADTDLHSHQDSIGRRNMFNLDTKEGHSASMKAPFHTISILSASDHHTASFPPRRICST
jgi:hypothetical protein